jgi:predicted Zn finger-like uncharacterized protein
MEVRCPACAARYNADDEKLRGKTARMRCKACNTVWLVSGAGALAPTDGPPLSVALDSSRPPASKRAAVVKRGAEREKRDLFAERDSDAPGSSPSSSPSSMRSSDAPPPSFGFSGGVGARNETSVLFRVDQLALAKTQLAPAGPASRAASSNERHANANEENGPRVADDEGVIDLKALSSRPPPSGHASALAPRGPLVAPLFSEPPPVTLEVEGGMRPNVKPTSRLAIAGIAAGSVVVLAAAIFGLSIAFRSEEPVKHTAAVVSVLPPPAPTPSASAAATPAPSASVADNSDPKELPKAKRGHGRGRHAAAGSSGAATPKAPKPADPCGCHGDFNCVLACSAKGKM